MSQLLRRMRAARFPLWKFSSSQKEAAQFILAAYSICKILKDQFGRKPTLPEFKQAIAKDTKRGPLSDEQVEAILKKIKELD
jgi:hypothetical protein